MVLKKGGRHRYVYHAWRGGQVGGSDLFTAAYLPEYPVGEFPRVPLVDRIRWRANWPVIGDGTPSVRP